MRLLGTVFIFIPVALFNVSCSGTPEVQAQRAELIGTYDNPPFYEVNGERYYTLSTSRGYRETGIASWYGAKFDGQLTANGEIYDMYAMTAAHRSLPLPSYVQVTNLENGRQVIVRVNDRGPFHPDRIIDLSYAAAVKLGFAQQGTGRVEVCAVNPQTGEPYPSPNEMVNSLNREFYLQVAAFQSRRHAEKLQRRLQALLDAVVSVSLTQHQQPVFHRVRVGPLSSVEKLDALAGRLADLGFPDSIIVR